MAARKTITGKNAQELQVNFHNYLRQYQAQQQPDVSSSDGLIFYSRPVRKWLLARKKGNKITVTFHDDCPCGDL